MEFSVVDDAYDAVVMLKVMFRCDTKLKALDRAIAVAMVVARNMRDDGTVTIFGKGEDGVKVSMIS